MATGTPTVPELTQEQVQKILVQPLEEASKFLAAGPRIFDSASPVRIPKLNGMTLAPTFIGENEEIPDDTNMDTTEVTLLPQTMKSIKVITRFSNELARQSVIALDQALKDRLVADVANVLDNALIASTVTDGTQPLGLLNYAGVQQMTAFGAITAVAAIDKLQDAIGAMLAADVDTTKLRWWMRSRDFVAVRKLKDTTNRYLVQPDPVQAGAYQLLGIPITVTNRIPGNGGVNNNESAIVLADFSTIAVARDLAPTVTVLSERYAEFDQLALRVVTRYDAAPLLPEAILIMRGVTA